MAHNIGVRKISTAAALVLASVVVAGCSGLGDNFGPTSALPEPARVDPVCSQLAASIDGLRREGVPEKVEKAALKKYKMKTSDLTKAAQLNKANDEFQARCSNMPRSAGPLSAPMAVKSTAAKAPPATLAPAATAEAPAASPTAPSDALVRTARATTPISVPESPSTPEAITASSSSSGGN